MLSTTRTFKLISSVSMRRTSSSSMGVGDVVGEDDGFGDGLIIGDGFIVGEGFIAGVALTIGVVVGTAVCGIF